MKRVIIVCLAALTLSIGLVTVPARAHHRPGPCSADRHHWWKAWNEDRNVEPIKRIIRCAALRWPVAGGPRKALSVAACESGFRPNAYANGNAGVYQHRIRNGSRYTGWWEDRYARFTRPRWRLFPGVYNGRTNVIVSIRMAHAGGWGPWSCA